MTDELFDYFGKGSKKFEPLDDDLDLPEVSPKRVDAAEQSDEQTPVDDEKPVDTEPVGADGDDDDVFAAFGAGLFEDETAALPPRKQAPKVKAEAKVEPKAKVESKPVSYTHLTLPTILLV